MKAEFIKKNVAAGISILLICFIIGSCEVIPGEIVNQEWKLIKYGDEASPVAVVSGSVYLPEDSTRITIKLFEDNTFRGTDVCNKITGKYTSTTMNEIHFTNISLSEKTCPPDYLEQSGKIEYIFSECNEYKVSGNQLTLITPERKVLIYSKTE